MTHKQIYKGCRRWGQVVVDFLNKTSSSILQSLLSATVCTFPEDGLKVFYYLPAVSAVGISST